MTNKNVSPAATRLQGLTDQAIRHVIDTANALELGRVADAERHIVGAMALFPEHPEVLRLLAGTQHLRGRLSDATATMRRAVALRPDDALYHNTLGAVLGEDSNYDAAIASLRRACELEPELATAWYNLGLILMRSVRPVDAAVALRKAVELDPNHARARAMLGDMLRASGRIDEATAEYRRVIKQRPHAGTAWWGLADLKTSKLGDSDIQQMRRAMQQPNVGDDDLIATGFALAKALDDEGRYQESLDVLAQANMRARHRNPWNAATFSANLDGILQAFTPPPAGAPVEMGNEVIFIASMPRSGSTLIEQILASHSQVEGAGELTDLPQVLSDESRRRRKAFPHWVAEMTPQDWQRLGEEYLQRTAHWRQTRPKFTDKLPNNWLYIGAAQAMLPNARFICCRRDPLETCLSCYRQFLANNEYTRTFPDLAAYWRDFDRAVRHWQSAYPQRVYENIYEDLVAQPEKTIREVLAFCGLDFEQACLDFHKTERDVHSPSATQVRQPLRSDTARSARYGALLNPLRVELGYAPLDSPQSVVAVTKPVAPMLPSADALYAEFAATLERGDGPAAVATLLQRMTTGAQTAEDWQAITQKLIQQGLPFPAATLLEQGLRQFPNAIELRYLRGNARRQEKNYTEAEQDFRDVLRAQPAHRYAALSLAFMLRERGRTEAAAEVIDASWQVRGDDAAEVLAMLTFLRECSAHWRGHAIAQTARQRWPENAEIAAVAGEIALAVGDFDAAQRDLRATLDRDPEKAASWLRLTRCQRYVDHADPDIRRMQSAWSRNVVQPATRICVGFALGKAYDDLGDFADATQILREANNMARNAVRWRSDEWKKFVDSQIAAGSLSSLVANPSFTPLFVVGLPRTGTTLLATQLARSAHVRDRGELNWISATHTNLLAQNLQHDTSALATTATLITTQMRRDDSPARYYLDKNPLNFRYLGFIKALFPNARIIHCRRNLRDTALSIWMQHFAHEDLAFAYDFSSIAEVANGHDRLMAHWRSKYPSQILELDYEALVNDPALQAQRLAEFLGIEAAPLLEQIAAPNIVTTASVWQARQPLYTRSIGRWQHYAPHLPELAQLFSEDGG